MAPRFNPLTGEWEGLEPPRIGGSRGGSSYGGRTVTNTVDFGSTIYGNTSTSSSWWSRFSESISRIGERLGDMSDSFQEKSGMAIMWLFWILGALGLISIAFSGHWIIAIVLGFLLGALYVQVTAFIAVVLAWLLFIPFAALRYIFYNGWTFLLFSATAVGIGLAAYTTQAPERPYPPYYYSESNTSAVSQIYYCTAYQLMIRNSPSTQGIVIGSFEYGDEIEVTDYDASPSFAQIDYYGEVAYVGKNYISKTDPQW